MDTPKFEELNSSNCTERSIKIHYPEFHAHLLQSYPEELKFTERLYWYYHNISERPRCIECGQPTTFVNLKVGYREFCSRTCLNKSSITQDRRVAACKEHMGVDNPMKSETVKTKLKQTNLERYGVENPFQLDSVKDKIKTSNISKYGVPYPMQSAEILERSRQTILDKYGVEWNCMRGEARNYSNNSKPNVEFAEFLTKHNISFEREFNIGRYSYDFKVGNILIEIDPAATHNSNWGPFNTEGKSKTYHKDKSELAKLHGYRCIHVWDWDDMNKILNQIQPQSSIGARKCVISDVSTTECKTFLDTYHFQNSCNGQTVRLGLYYNDELVEIMTFGKPRYNKNYEWELLRLCSSKYVSGGTKKLFKYFIEQYNPKSIISYCDASKFDGSSYIDLGFENASNPSPSKHWWNGKVHITNNLLKQRGFDQLFDTNYGKGTSNEQLMIDHGFVEIYDCGQLVFKYNK